MDFQKPLHDVPVRSESYKLERQGKTSHFFAVKLLAGAVVAGVVIGFLSSNAGSPLLVSRARDLAVSQGLIRKNRPMPGAYYAGCDEARAAGVAPLYAGEPGYRPEMDGDDDGIACEPHRGVQ